MTSQFDPKARDVLHQGAAQLVPHEMGEAIDGKADPTGKIWRLAIRLDDVVDEFDHVRAEARGER